MKVWSISFIAMVIGASLASVFVFMVVPQVLFEPSIDLLALCRRQLPELSLSVLAVAIGGFAVAFLAKRAEA